MTTSAFRLLRRPVRGAAFWGGAGIGAGMALPSILSSAGLIYSTSLMTTTACGGAIAILLPLGIARGVISSLQLLLIEEGNVKNTVEQISKEAGPTMALENPKLLWEKMTFGGGWQGRTLRTIASPFLPSTAQMLSRVQESVDSGQAESKVLAAAADGFVEGFLQDKKDTVTMIGVVGYAALLGVGIGVDYSYRRVNESKKAASDSVRQKKEAAIKVLQETKQKIEDRAPSIFKDTKEETDEDDKSTSEGALETTKTSLKAKKQQLKDSVDKWISPKRD